MFQNPRPRPIPNVPPQEPYLPYSFPFHKSSVSLMPCGTKDAGKAKINYTTYVSFLELFGTPEFLASFNFGSRDLKDFLRRVHAGITAPTRSVVAVLIEKSQRRSLSCSKLGLLWMETRGCESSAKSRCSRFCVRCFLFSRNLKETRAFTTLLPPAQRGIYLRSILEWGVAPLGRIEDRLGTICVYEGPSLVLHFCPYSAWGSYMALFVLSCDQFDSEKGCQWPYATYHRYQDWLCPSDNGYNFHIVFKNSWTGFSDSADESILEIRPWLGRVWGPCIPCRWLRDTLTVHFSWGWYKSYA